MDPPTAAASDLYHNHTAAGDRILLQQLNDDIAMDLIPAMVFIALLMIMGLAGNLVVCFIFSFRLRMSTQHILIVSLAVFDLLSCIISMPTEIADMRYFLMFEDEFACRLLRFINSYCAFASILTLIVIAVDRFRKVCRPLGRQMSLRHTKMALVAVLLVALIFAIPSAMIYGIRTAETPDPHIFGHDCTVNDDVKDTLFPLIYNSILFIAFFVIFIALTVIYVKIWREMRRHNRYMARNSTSTSSRKGSLYPGSVSDVSVVTSSETLRRASETPSVSSKSQSFKKPYSDKPIISSCRGSKTPRSRHNSSSSSSRRRNSAQRGDSFQSSAQRGDSFQHSAQRGETSLPKCEHLQKAESIRRGCENNETRPAGRNRHYSTDSDQNSPHQSGSCRCNSFKLEGGKHEKNTSNCICRARSSFDKRINFSRDRSTTGTCENVTHTNQKQCIPSQTRSLYPDLSNVSCVQQHPLEDDDLHSTTVDIAGFFSNPATSKYADIHRHLSRVSEESVSVSASGAVMENVDLVNLDDEDLSYPPTDFHTEALEKSNVSQSQKRHQCVVLMEREVHTEQHQHFAKKAVPSTGFCNPSYESDVVAISKELSADSTTKVHSADAPMEVCPQNLSSESTVEDYFKDLSNNPPTEVYSKELSTDLTTDDFPEDLSAKADDEGIHDCEDDDGTQAAGEGADILADNEIDSSKCLCDCECCAEGSCRSRVFNQRYCTESRNLCLEEQLLDTQCVRCRDKSLRSTKGSPRTVRFQGLSVRFDNKDQSYEQENVSAEKQEEAREEDDHHSHKRHTTGVYNSCSDIETKSNTLHCEVCNNKWQALPGRLNSREVANEESQQCDADHRQGKSNADGGIIGVSKEVECAVAEEQSIPVILVASDDHTTGKEVQELYCSCNSTSDTNYAQHQDASSSVQCVGLMDGIEAGTLHDCKSKLHTLSEHSQNDGDCVETECQECTGDRSLDAQKLQKHSEGSLEHRIEISPTILEQENVEEQSELPIITLAVVPSRHSHTTVREKNNENATRLQQQNGDAVERPTSENECLSSVTSTNSAILTQECTCRERRERDEVKETDDVEDEDAVFDNSEDEKDGGSSIRSTVSTKKRQVGKSISKSSAPETVKTYKATVIAMSVTVVFFLSFLPHLSLVTARIIREDFDRNLRGAALLFYNLFIRSYFINSVSNPVIYGVLNAAFRAQLFKLMRQICSSCRRND